MEYNLPELPERVQISNKGTYGKFLNFAGSEFMPGAAYLSSVSALKVGAGYVKLVSKKSVLDNVAKLAPEIVLSLSKKITEDINVISFGCGCDINDDTFEILDYIREKRKNIPTVIDADGLNVLAKCNYKFDSNVILTPHPMEAARLLNCTLDEILAKTEESAKKIAKKYNCIAVLKLHNTIVTDGEFLYSNNSGCSALAKAGSGDVLCGIISGLLAQKMTTLDAAVLGVYLHGLSGELAAKDLSEYGVLASDLLRYIPIAIKNYLELGTKPTAP